MKSKIIGKKKLWLSLLILIIVVTGCNGSNYENPAVDTPGSENANQAEGAKLTYALPAPETKGEMSVQEALANRRSERNFKDQELSLEELSQILWAAYGVTSPRPDDPAVRGGLRTAPSAGARYPLEVYAIVGKVVGIDPGVYKYDSAGHQIMMVVEGDMRKELSDAALSQNMVSQAPLTVFYSAITERTTERYGERGHGYVYIELGHSAQNVYLQAEALGLGTCAVGAFSEDALCRVLKVPDNETPLYLMPVGYC